MPIELRETHTENDGAVFIIDHIYVEMVRDIVEEEMLYEDN